MPASCPHSAWLAQSLNNSGYRACQVSISYPVFADSRAVTGVAARRWTYLPLESHCRHPE